MTAKITREELQAKMAVGEDLILVEALPPRYFAEAHLPGAINLPHDQVDSFAAQLLPDRNAQIVVYCANAPCKNSGIAAERLTALGYTDVRDYHEGKADWIAAGLPTERGFVAQQVAAE